LLSLIKTIFEKRNKAKLIIPAFENEYQRAFFDEMSYIFLLDKSSRIDYNKYLNNIIETIINNIQYKNAQWMLLKIYGFLQGSDNQVVINSARKYGCDRIFLPYASPEFIYSTVQYKNNLKEIFFPKYVISKLLRQYGYKPIKTSVGDVYSYPASTFFEEKVTKKYFEYIAKNNR
jgi:hypothetical protein